MHNIIRLGDQVLAVASLSFFVMMIVACTPTVKVESPQEPITINLNIKLDADIRVKLEEEAKKDIAANPDVF